MAHPSNPRLMNRVLDAVVHLSEGKGSTARDVLDFLRQASRSTPRNLTMQENVTKFFDPDHCAVVSNSGKMHTVESSYLCNFLFQNPLMHNVKLVYRALKHAVNAGLIRHRSGRYKVLYTLNPAAKQPVNENNNEKAVDDTSGFNAQQPSTRVSSDRREENRLKHKAGRQDRRRKRSRSRQRRRRPRRSGSRKRESPVKDMGEIQKLRYKEKVERDRSPRHRFSENRMRADIGNASTSSPNRKRNKPKHKDQTYYSDLSDSSDYDDGRSRERRRTPVCKECKYDGRRSVSRHRSPQRKQSQQLQMKHTHDNDKGHKTDSDNRRNDRNNTLEEKMEKDREPNNSGSGSTL